MQSGRAATVLILLSAARSDIDDSESVIEHHYSIRDSIRLVSPPVTRETGVRFPVAESNHHQILLLFLLLCDKFSFTLHKPTYAFSCDQAVEPFRLHNDTTVFLSRVLPAAH